MSVCWVWELLNFHVQITKRSWNTSNDKQVSFVWNELNIQILSEEKFWRRCMRKIWQYFLLFGCVWPSECINTLENASTYRFLVELGENRCISGKRKDINHFNSIRNANRNNVTKRCINYNNVERKKSVSGWFELNASLIFNWIGKLFIMMIRQGEGSPIVYVGCHVFVFCAWNWMKS